MRPRYQNGYYPWSRAVAAILKRELKTRRVVVDAVA